MNLNATMAGLIPPKQLAETMLLGLQQELGFTVRKADLIYQQKEDKMYFEILLPEGTEFNTADRDQFKKYGVGEEVWKRYHYGMKDMIKQALLPMVNNLTEHDIKQLSDIDFLVLRFDGKQFELITAATVNGVSSKTSKIIE